MKIGINLKSLWLLIQINWLLYILYELIIYNPKDIDLFFFIIEYIVTFPSAYLIGVINYLYSFVYIPPDYFNDILYRTIYIFINWIFFVVIGYIQWFIFFPKMYKFLKKLSGSR